MALLTAAVLGGILLAVLGSHYPRAEESYLKRRQAGGRDPPPLTTDSGPHLSGPRWRRSPPRRACGSTTQAARWSWTRARPTTSTRRRCSAAATTSVTAAVSAITTAAEPARQRALRHRRRCPLRAGSLTIEHGQRLLRQALRGAGVRPRRLAQRGHRLASGGRARRRSRGPRRLSDRRAHLAAGGRAHGGERPHGDGDLGARAPVPAATRSGASASPSTAWPRGSRTTVTSLRRFVADAAHEIGTPLTALQADLELAERQATSADERRLVDRALAQTGRLATSRTTCCNSRASRPASLPARGRAPTSPPSRWDWPTAWPPGRSRPASSWRSTSPPAPLRPDGARAPADGPRQPARQRREVHAGGRHRHARRAQRGCERGDHPGPDTGVGIPAEEQREIFERFHRARNVSAYPGNGLGLAIVKAAVERSGGTVTFTSTEAGTTFTVRLPLATAD